MFEVTASCSLRSGCGPTISVRRETWQKRDFVFVCIPYEKVKPNVYLSPGDAIQVANEMLRLAANIQEVAASA